MLWEYPAKSKIDRLRARLPTYIVTQGKAMHVKSCSRLQMHFWVIIS